MEYMIRFTHVHEEFRLAEVEALAVLEGIDLEILSYSHAVCWANIQAEKYIKKKSNLYNSSHHYVL